MLLGLACGNTFFDMPDSATSPMNITNVDIATVAKQAFYDFGERPMWAERHVYGMSNRSLTYTLFNVFL